MTLTHPPMTFNGQIVNLQIVLGGSPIIHNYAHPPESPRSTRPRPQSSHSGSPSVSNSPRASSAARDHSRNPSSHNNHAPATAMIPFPSPHPAPSPFSTDLLSPIGSPMANLNGLQARTVIAHGQVQSSTAEDRVHHLPSPAVYIRSNAGDQRLRGHERVDNSLSQQDGYGYTANLYRSTPHVSFPIPHLQPSSFPTPVNLHVWPMPVPDRFDWPVDEREDGDHLDDEGYH